MHDSPSFRVLQVTDMHLQQDTETQLKGYNVEQRFQEVMACIQKEDADLLLLTGDLSHHAPAAYERISEYLQTLSFPSAWIPGNHDLHPEMLCFADLGYGQKIIDKGRWCLILLDTTANPDGKGSGSLADSELEFLTQALDKRAPEQHVLIVMHHHPISVKSAWQDDIGLANKDDFWRIVDRYSCVKAVMFGHVHQQWSLERGQVKLFSTPATAPQYKAGTERPVVETDTRCSGAAYGRFQLFDDGNIQAEVIRLPA